MIMRRVTVFLDIHVRVFTYLDTHLDLWPGKIIIIWESICIILSLSPLCVMSITLASPGPQAPKGPGTPASRL